MSDGSIAIVATPFVGSVSVTPEPTDFSINAVAPGSLATAKNTSAPVRSTASPSASSTVSVIVLLSPAYISIAALT